MFSTRIEAFSSPKYFLYCQAILKPSSCEITYPEQYKKKNARWQFNLLMKIIQVTYTSSSITTCSSPHHSVSSILLWRRNRSRQCTTEQPRLLQRSCKEQGLLVHDALCHEASKKQKVVWCIRVFHDHYDWAKKEPTHHPKALQERANKWRFGDYQCTSQTSNTSIVFISICNFKSYAVFITLINFNAHLVCTPYSYQANYYIVVFHLHIFQIKPYQFSLPKPGGRGKANIGLPKTLIGTVFLSKHADTQLKKGWTSIQERKKSWNIKKRKMNLLHRDHVWLGHEKMSWKLLHVFCKKISATVKKMLHAHNIVSSKEWNC